MDSWRYGFSRIMFIQIVIHSSKKSPELSLQKSNDNMDFEIYNMKNQFFKIN